MSSFEVIAIRQWGKTGLAPLMVAGRKEVNGDAYTKVQSVVRSHKMHAAHESPKNFQSQACRGQVEVNARKIETLSVTVFHHSSSEDHNPRIRSLCLQSGQAEVDSDG